MRKTRWEINICIYILLKKIFLATHLDFIKSRFVIVTVVKYCLRNSIWKCGLPRERGKIYVISDEAGIKGIKMRQIKEDIKFLLAGQENILLLSFYPLRRKHVTGNRIWTRRSRWWRDPLEIFFHLIRAAMSFISQDPSRDNFCHTLQFFLLDSILRSRPRENCH